MTVLTNTQTGFKPDAGTIDVDWQAGRWSFTVIVDGHWRKDVYALDFVGRRVLVPYPNAESVPWFFAEEHFTDGIPDDAVECQESVCQWIKPETLEVWLIIDDWYEVDLCSATMRKREG